MNDLLAVVASYLIGSIPVGYLVARSMGVDIRQHGSGNIGTTNVWRTLGKVAGIIVLLGDVGKGVLSVLIGRQYGAEGTELLTGLAAMVGHSWPVFLGFKGGKIIATGAGVLLGIAPLSALIAFAVWLPVVAISRYVSLGSIAAAISLPTGMLAMHQKPSYLAFGTLVAVFAIYKHKTNIKRLMTGTELKIGKKND